INADIDIIISQLIFSIGDKFIDSSNSTFYVILYSCILTFVIIKCVCSIFKAFWEAYIVELDFLKAHFYSFFSNSKFIIPHVFVKWVNKRIATTVFPNLAIF